VVLLAAHSKETMFYTYAHYKPDNSVFYIGKGQRNRAWAHDNRNQYWKNVVAKHGEHKVEILAKWPTEQEAFEHEIFLIWCFRDMGYTMANLTDGGEGCSGMKVSQESIQKRLESMKGYVVSEKTKSKMRESSLGKKNHFFGKIHSKESKEKISEAKKANPSKPWEGKLRSEETKKKIANSLRGRVGSKHTDESKAKLSLAHAGKKQAPPSEETCKKLSESVKASWILRRQKVRKEV
jgi:hypothetical protein